MGNINKRQFILIIVSIVLTGATLITAVFAWFSYSTAEQSIILSTGTMEVKADLYKANDPDCDGVFDPDTAYEVQTSAIELNNLVSGQIYSFKLVIKNNGTIPGKLKVTFMNLPNNTLNNALTLKYSNLDGTINDNTKTVFPNGNFVAATKDSLSHVSGSNETVLLFQIVVNKNLTNAHYGVSFVISSIQVELEQIPPELP
mgnify:CR=1 FL=1|jgi:hypothetical protein